MSAEESVSESLPPGLYLVGTPIGNLADITYRAVDTLRRVDRILCEDTRRSSRLLQHYEISKPLASCHKFNEASRRDWLVNCLEGGEAVAMITDAGMPCISDPGGRTVRACRQAGFPVTVLPGPTAVSTAAALSGYVECGYLFEGFLPVKSGRRNRRLDELVEMDCPVLLYESPYRIVKLLGELSERLGEREIFVCRELTKKFEEALVATGESLRVHFESRGKPRGEFVVVIPPVKRQRGQD